MPGSAQPVAGPAAFLAEIRALSARLTALETWIRLQEGTGWIEPALLNSWVYFGAPQTTPAYQLDGNWLSFKGLVAGGATGTLLFTLPAGFRPTHNTHPTAYWASVGGELKVLEIIVNTAGEVILTYGAGTLSFASLDGVRIPIS